VKERIGVKDGTLIFNLSNLDAIAISLKKNKLYGDNNIHLNHVNFEVSSWYLNGDGM
jgi:hypothetical protein